MDPSKFILIVDDDEDIRTSVHEVLEDAGFPARMASDGADALRLLQTHPQAAVILLDLMMPVMNGWQLMDELQKDPNLASIPILLITADASASKKADAARESGYNTRGFLRKPFKVESLLAAVGTYM